MNVRDPFILIILLFWRGSSGQGNVEEKGYLIGRKDKGISIGALKKERKTTGKEKMGYWLGAAPHLPSLTL